MGSRNLLGEAPSDAQVAKYSLETAPPADTPPTFLLHAADDASVPVENSLLLFSALKAASVPTSLHIFETGGHGFGLRGLDNDPRRLWPDMVMDWGRAHGIFKPPA